MSERFDLVISGGRVIDPETGLDAIRNVGIKGGSITAVVEDEIQGTETIDATGHVVAPGFIDMHNHNPHVPFGQKLALRDGVTSPMELEAGVYPVKDWYASLEGKSQTNYGASSGTVAVREHTFNPAYQTKYFGDFAYDIMGFPKEAHMSMKWSTVVATPEQVEQFSETLEDGIKQGSIGIGHTPGYMVSGVSQAESHVAQELAGKYGQATFVHARYSSQMPPASGLLGFDEMMAPQAAYGGGLVLQHMTAQALNDTPAALKLVDAARARGVEVLAEIYPYTYGGSIVAADYLHPDNYGPNMGRDYKDIIEVSNLKPLTKERYDELIKTAPSTAIMFYNATDEMVQLALAHPDTVVGSDAFPYTIKASGLPALDWDTPFDAVNGHPRGSGTHARMLKWSREKTIDITLSTTISKMSFMIAKFLGDNGVPQMTKKGRVQEGMDADLAIFDPATVTDNSTMGQGGLPSTGIPFVVVNGTIVVRDSEVLKGVFPGQAIYGNQKAK